MVVVSGAPGRKDREKDPLLHHKVKTFETQRRVYDEVTVASTVLLDEQRAASEIVRCVEACLRHKRPVYIEVPHDMVDREIPVNGISAGVPEKSDPQALEAALDETLSLIRAAKKPVILAGVELARYRTAGLVVRMAERMNIPIAADLLSKSAVPENHRLYLGVYGGAMSSDEHVRKYVESADLVLMLGTFITDMSMGFYTAKLDRKRTVLATSERVNIRYHRYESIQFRDFLESLATTKIRQKQFIHPNPHAVPAPLKKSERSDAAEHGRCLSHSFVAPRRALLCCCGYRRRDLWRRGDSQRAAGAIHRAGILYVDGICRSGGHRRCVGCQKLRPYVLVGDGAFQMTGAEISTAVRLGINPIIMILNNDGYGTMRKIRKGSFNVITQWNYARICDLVGGGKSATVTTNGEFDAALSRAQKSGRTFVIELKIPPDDVSQQLARIAHEVRKVRGTGK